MIVTLKQVLDVVLSIYWIMLGVTVISIMAMVQFDAIKSAWKHFIKGGK